MNFENLSDMELEFYQLLQANNTNLSDLEFTHPLNVMSTMFMIAREGQTEEGWISFVTLENSLFEEELEKRAQNDLGS